MEPSRYLPASIINRYLSEQFVRLFLATMVVFVLLYTVVDFFDRLDILLRHHASMGAAARYFLFKIPLMVTQVMPPAVMTSVLLSFALLGRHNEITALRAGGVSLLQTAVPVIAWSVLISIGALLWNETVVPYCTRKFEHVNNVEIRKRTLRGLLSDREVWYHGSQGFYNIDYVDKAGAAIHGLVIYRFDDRFRLQSVVEVPVARWVQHRWVIAGGVEHRLAGGAFEPTILKPGDLVLSETMADFLEVRRKPDELSFTLLRRWIDHLTRKGIDASEYLVDLHMKLAVPFANAVLALVALPLAGRIRRHPSVAVTVGLGSAVGFVYWVVLGLAQSLGHGGAVPPILAAWSANLLFCLLGTAFFLFAE